MLYNVTTMATTWNSVAANDIRLLRKQMDVVNSLPKEYTFLNYLRCHDDIGWGLDYDTLEWWGMKEIPHKRFLNDFFTGRIPGSVSRGELYNDDPVTQDARFCGTTASMCGIESAGFECNALKLKEAVQMDIMLHAYMLTQTGIPMLYSGDEIGQVNDYSYKENAAKYMDSRYVHRGKFHWELAELRDDTASVEGQIFQALLKLENIRRRETVFSPAANVYTYDVKDDAVLCIMRELGEDKFFAIFNFGSQMRTAWMQEEGDYIDLLTGEDRQMKDVWLPAHGFVWAKRKQVKKDEKGE